MKSVEQLKPTYAPVYAALYPRLAAVFQTHGYALAIHGSLQRDFDVVAVTWAETISKPEEMLKEITNGWDIRLVDEPVSKNHGRVAYTISIGHGDCALDLSFFPAPILANAETAQLTEAVADRYGIEGFTP